MTTKTQPAYSIQNLFHAPEFLFYLPSSGCRVFSQIPRGAFEFTQQDLPLQKFLQRAALKRSIQHNKYCVSRAALQVVHV